MARQEDPAALHSPLCGLPRGVQGLSPPKARDLLGLVAGLTPPLPQVYAVATSTNTACTRIPRMTGEEKEFENIERGRRRSHWACSSGRLSLTGALSLQMTVTSTPSRRPSPSSLSPQSAGKPSPTPGEAGAGGAGGRQVAGLHPDSASCRIELEEWEHVTCMKTVSLRSEETVSGLKGYVAAGTCLMQGEEVTCRGRVSGQRPAGREPCGQDPVHSLRSPSPSARRS